MVNLSKFISNSEIWSWIQVTLDVILKNITSPNNLLLNLYFENPTVGLHVLYDLNMHANCHVNQM